MMNTTENKMISFTLTLCVLVCTYVFLQLTTIDHPIIESKQPEANIEIVEEVEIKLSEIEINNSEDPIKNAIRDLSSDDFSGGKNENNNNQEFSDNQKTNNEQTIETKTIPINDEIKVKKDITQTQEGKKEKESYNQPKGNVMVEFKVQNRTAYDNNLWYVRNPGYKCGHNSGGTVYIDIVVDCYGVVISAKHNKDKSINANSCMIEEGIEYAKKSKFSSHKDKTQSGYIKYTFVSQ